jgi:hypothetical protein
LSLTISISMQLTFFVKFLCQENDLPFFLLFEKTK